MNEPAKNSLPKPLRVVQKLSAPRGGTPSKGSNTPQRDIPVPSPELPEQPTGFIKAKKFDPLKSML
jgi:hypothetical protein